MEQRNIRPSRLGLGSILLRLALLLAVLTLLCVHLMGGLYAKYTATGNGSDSARVAKFDVNVTGVPEDAIAVNCTAYDANTGTCTITVENKSEVAVNYVLSIAMTGNTDGVSATFSPDSGDLPVGGSGSSTLTFTVDWAAFTMNKTGESASETLEFTVTVNVTQID